MTGCFCSIVMIVWMAFAVVCISYLGLNISIGEAGGGQRLVCVYVAVCGQCKIIWKMSAGQLQPYVHKRSA